MVSGLLGVGALGAGAAELGEAFCAGMIGCSPDRLEGEAGRADTGVCGAVAGEGCTSFFLMAVMRSRLKVKTKTTNYLSDEDTGIDGRRWKYLRLGGSAKAHLVKHGLGASSGTPKPFAPLLGGGIIAMRGNGELAFVPDTSRCGIRSSTGGCTSWAPREPR